MTQGDEDKAWQEIVENWADEPAVGDAPDIEALLVHPVKPVDPPREIPIEPVDTWNPVPFSPEDDGDTFVPPIPPRAPLPTPARMIAWSGVIGAPALFLLFLVIGVRLPSWASTLMVASFLGGFVFLVATMSNEPRDPSDDGAVV